jgi:ribosome-associated translation inhibitor RaiA
VTEKTVRPQGEPFLAEQLAEVVSRYRHAAEEHRRTTVEGRRRRRVEQELDELSARFERLLALAAADEEMRALWRAHLRGAAPAPPLPEPAPTLLFRGRSETGAELRILGLGAHELDVVVDGARVERLDRADELLTDEPGLAFRVGDTAHAETFAATRASIAALGSALQSGRPAPADRELMLDGLVDRTFGLTPRGRRALAALRERPRPAAGDPGPPVEIVTRGRVGRAARARLRRELVRLAEVAPRRVLRARGTLTVDENPSLERPVRATASIELDGHVVHARASAAGTAEAVDRLVGRLRRSLRQLRGRQESARRAPAAAAGPVTKRGS